MEWLYFLAGALVAPSFLLITLRALDRIEFKKASGDQKLKFKKRVFEPRFTSPDPGELAEPGSRISPARMSRVRRKS